MAPINVGHIPSPDPSEVTDQQIEEGTDTAGFSTRMVRERAESMGLASRQGGTMSIEQVNEALAEYDGTQYLIPRDAMQTVVEAARRFVDGWETCPTCEGKGGYNVQSTRGPIETDYLVCPDCVDGMVPGPQLVERLKVVAGREMNRLVSELRHEWRPLFGSDVEPIVRAVLLASRRGDTE